jgi:acetyl esterase/lipase
MNVSKCRCVLALAVGLLSAQMSSCDDSSRIKYGEASQQFAELRLPKGSGRFPVVAILHGGCWIEYADVAYTAPLAAALTSRGYATWNVEYRRAQEEGGGWPGTFEDAERGVGALRKAAVKYPLDLRRVVVIGHSAGGQLALYAGSRLKWPVISLAGVVDMKAYINGGPKGCVNGELQVMGGKPDAYPDRYAKVSPAQLLPLGIPQVLIWAAGDDIVPESLFTDYEQQAKGAEIIRVAGAGHQDLCVPKGPAWDALLMALAKLAPQRNE